MAKNSRNKGKRGEQEVVDLLKEHGYEARRGQQYTGGDGSPDVVHNVPGVHVEVKRVEQLSLYPAMEQASRDAAGKAMPAVFHRRNDQRWVVVVWADDFLSLMREAFEPADVEVHPRRAAA